MPAETALSRHIRGKVRSHRPDVAIAELAERQYGVVSRTQLLTLGLGEDAIDHRLRLGRLHRLHRGVYAVGHSVVSREGRWIAAVLAGGPQAVLSHRSAAALWGLRETSSAWIEITTPSTSRSRGAIRRHRGKLPPDEIALCRQVPTTTVPRTLFDLAAVLSVDRLEAAMRKAEFLQLYNRLSLPDLLHRYPGHRGNAKLRSCLEERGGTIGFTRSELEERFLFFVDRAGLPRPQLNAQLQMEGRWIEVDCLWRDARLIVELDGRAAHGTLAAFEADRERDRRLQSAGWRVVRVTWRQLHDESTALARDLRAMLLYPT